MSHYEPPAVTISASIATPTKWQSTLTSIGTLTAVNGTDISSEASGIVTEIRFTSGQFVQQGEVLVLLDTSVEQANLQNDKAKLTLAQLNFDRNKALMKKNVVAQSVLDQAAAELEEAQANVQATEAKIKQKTIVAPFSGKIGIKKINLGQYVSAGTAMVSLQSLDPLYVEFNIPEQYLSELYLQQPIEIGIHKHGSMQTQFPGFINALNSKIDQDTRNILVQATVPNKELHLFPGMFAMVKILLRDQKNVITLPQTAISYSLHGDSVFIIKADKQDSDGKPILHAYRQYVKVGDRREGEVAIMSGIQAGDQVVTSGQLKLQNGAHVVIDNSVDLT